jgi:hypothetical protein
MTDDPATANHSALNKAIYYWDWYLLHGEVDNLVAAATFMRVYRESGGLAYRETEAHIKAHLERKEVKT